ncbi:MAG: hypothetical protein FWC80_03610 [Firmicutes bacterium]|nr:hypothetical protein [Bacillota bacterium]
MSDLLQSFFLLTTLIIAFIGIVIAFATFYWTFIKPKLSHDSMDEKPQVGENKKTKDEDE